MPTARRIRLQPMSSPSAVAVAQTFGLSKVYGVGAAAVAALDDVTVEFGRGRLTAIMGPSGSGKSTLMHCMAALDTPTSGRVVIDGIDISDLKDKALTMLRRDRLGFVFQAYNLVPTLTARENITLPVDIAGAKLDAAWFDTVVDTLGIRDRLSHRPDELSGGQQQRVACARALVEQAGHRLRRRAHRQPGLPRQRGDPRLPARLGRRLRADHRDGDPRPGRCVVRRPGPLPRRRPDRRR